MIVFQKPTSPPRSHSQNTIKPIKIFSGSANESLAREVTQYFSDLVVVSPDLGGVARAKAFAKKLNDASLVTIDKRRQAHNAAQVMNLIPDVENKTAVIVDDIIDTADTIYETAKTLHQKGASQVYACATHAVFSPPAKERLSSGLFAEVIVTNTIPVPQAKQFKQLKVLSVASLLGETIWRVQQKSSVISIFS